MSPPPVEVKLVIVERDEAVHGLRCALSSLQKRLNRTSAYLAKVEERAVRLKEQLAKDRAYIDKQTEVVAAAEAFMATLLDSQAAWNVTPAASEWLRLSIAINTRRSARGEPLIGPRHFRP